MTLGNDPTAIIVLISHRREILSQIEKTLGKHNLETALNDGHVIVESIQKLAFTSDPCAYISERAKSAERSIVPSYVLVDEAHHCASPSYITLWDIWKESRILGVTATPCRLKKANFSDLFDTLILSWEISRFIKEGWLSLFNYVTVSADSEAMQNIEKLNKRGADGDYQIKEMNQVLNTRASIDQLYSSYKRFADGRQGIIYAINKQHASRICDYYKAQGESVMLIDSDTPTDERNRLMEAYRKGEIKIFVNCEIAGEGIDVPNVSFIQMGRPTLSLAKYLQQVGRGMRPHKNKENCIILDNVGMYYRFGLPNEHRDWGRMFRVGQIDSDKTHSYPTQTHRKGHSRDLNDGHNDPMVIVMGHSELNRQLEAENQPYTFFAKRHRYGVKQGDVERIGAKYMWVSEVVENFFLATRYNRPNGFLHLYAVDVTTGREIELPTRSGESIPTHYELLAQGFARNIHYTKEKTEIFEESNLCHIVDLKSGLSYDEEPDEIVTVNGFLEFLRYGKYYTPRTQNTHLQETNRWWFTKEQLEIPGDLFQKTATNGDTLFLHRRFAGRTFLLEGYGKYDHNVKRLYEPTTKTHWYYRKGEELKKRK